MIPPSPRDCTAQTHNQNATSLLSHLVPGRRSRRYMPLFDVTTFGHPRSGSGQDRAAIIEHGSSITLILADGAGGMSGGAEAADLVIQQTIQHMNSESTLLDATTCCEFLASLDAAIAADGEAGDTTAVVMSVSEAGVQGASLGDTESWIIRGSIYIDLTEHQRRKPLLGSGAAVPVPFAAELQVGDVLLIGSVGLFKYATPEAICAIVRANSAEAVAAKLVELVRLPSGDLWDDVAVLICRVAGA